MRTFVFVAFICIFGSLSEAFPVEKRNVVRDDERFLLDFCANVMDVGGCAVRHGFSLSLTEVFELLAVSPSWITANCHQVDMEECLTSTCDRQFQASKFGYMRSICTQRRAIVDHWRCWDEAFPDQASECVHRHYPEERREAFYPTPYRVYNQTTIARDCFPNGPEECRAHKASLLYHLMPQYYEIFPQPV